MEEYRSGHNENDSKSFWRDERHVGSNPTFSALGRGFWVNRNHDFFGNFLGTHKLMAPARVSKDEVLELASKWE